VYTNYITLPKSEFATHGLASEPVQLWTNGVHGLIGCRNHYSLCNQSCKQPTWFIGSIITMFLRLHGVASYWNNWIIKWAGKFT